MNYNEKKSIQNIKFLFYYSSFAASAPEPGGLTI